MNFGLPSVLPRVAGVGTADWSVWMDSNHRPRAYQARALTTWATNRYSVLILSHLSARVLLTLLSLVHSFSYEFRVMSYGVAFKQVWTLVEMMGFEPMTPCLQGRCSPNWATPPYHGLFSFQGSCRSLKIEQQKIGTKLSVYRPRRLVWQNRDILSRSP